MGEESESCGEPGIPVEVLEGLLCDVDGQSNTWR